MLWFELKKSSLNFVLIINIWLSALYNNSLVIIFYSVIGNKNYSLRSLLVHMIIIIERLRQIQLVATPSCWIVREQFLQ
jgi:hypothetical protein